MNKRIKELYEQAGLGHERWNTTEQFEKFMEKFASLIARRCMDIASLEALEIAEIDDGRPTFAASIATAGRIGQKIGLEFDLFGVEE